MLAQYVLLWLGIRNRPTLFFERSFNDPRCSPSKSDLVILYSIFITVAYNGKSSMREDLAQNPHYFSIGFDVFMTIFGHPLLYMLITLFRLSVYFLVARFGFRFWRWYLWLFIFAATSQFVAEIIFTLNGKGILQDTEFIANLHDPRMTWSAACYDQVKLQDPHALEKSQHCYGGYNITKDIAMEQTQRFRKSVGYSRSMAMACDSLYTFSLTIPNHIPVPGEMPDPYRGLETTERSRKRYRQRMIQRRERNVKRCYDRYGWVLLGQLEYDNCEQLEFCQWSKKTVILSDILRHAADDKYEGPEVKIIYPSHVKTWIDKAYFWRALVMSEILLRTQAR